MKNLGFTDGLTNGSAYLNSSNSIIGNHNEDIDEIGIVSETASDQSCDERTEIVVSDCEDTEMGKTFTQFNGDRGFIDDYNHTKCGDTEDTDVCSIPLDMSKLRNFSIESNGIEISATTLRLQNCKRKLSLNEQTAPVKQERHISPSSPCIKMAKRIDDGYDLSSLNEEDEDDEENDEDGELIVDHEADNFDSDRLKAFNMFVRLFVDENLDRNLSFSRQPKDKVQSILECCMRQFPEFNGRARKRIQGYLKSCRARPKSDLNGFRSTAAAASLTAAQLPGTFNLTSYHLNSPVAEQILAIAYENEIFNAKRINVGLKPIAIYPIERHSLPSSTVINTENSKSGSNCNFNSTLLAALTAPPKNGDNDCFRSSSSSNSSNRSPPHSTELNGQHQLPATGETPSPPMVPGPQPVAPPLAYALNPGETAAVKQLIAGYRESAAFLLRSANELEHLLLQQT